MKKKLCCAYVLSPILQLFLLLICYIAVCKLYTSLLSIIVYFYKSLFVYSVHVKCRQCRERHTHFWHLPLCSSVSANAAAVIKPLKYEGGGKANDVGEARIYVHQVHSDVRVQEGGACLRVGEARFHVHQVHSDVRCPRRWCPPPCRRSPHLRPSSPQ